MSTKEGIAPNATDELINPGLDKDEIFKLIRIYTQNRHDTLVRSTHRMDFVRVFSWSIPSKYTLRQIIRFICGDTVLEIGAGRGLWSLLLQKSGIPVIPTDIGKRGQYYRRREFKRAWTHVERISYDEAFQKYLSCNCLLVSWPSYYIQSIQEFKGNKIIYIGECSRGCTGAKSFFKELQEEWICVKCVKIPQWRQVRDWVYLYVRMNTYSDEDNIVIGKYKYEKISGVEKYRGFHNN